MTRIITNKLLHLALIQTILLRTTPRLPDIRHVQMKEVVNVPLRLKPASSGRTH